MDKTRGNFRLDKEAIQRYVECGRIGKDHLPEDLLWQHFLLKYDRELAKLLHNNLLKFRIIPLFLPKEDLLTFAGWINLRTMTKHFGPFKGEELVWWTGKPWISRETKAAEKLSETQIATKYCNLLEEKGWKIIRNDIKRHGPDIVAKLGKRLIIAECKRSSSIDKIYHALGQLLLYSKDYPNATLQIVTPSPVAPEIRSKLRSCGVETVVVDLNEEDSNE